MKEFVTAYREIETEGDEDGKDVVVFVVDGRQMKAYPPTEGQLAFMMAMLGRGQTNEQRLASILNLMFSVLEEEDRDYLEARLLERDPKKRLNMETLNDIFEYIMGEWFGRPTQPPSDSAESPPTDGQS